MQAGAVSDADFNALAIFRIARAAEVALRKAGAVSDANSMHSRPSPRNGCGQRSATAPWPGQRPAPPVHHAKKSSAALGAHAPHAPTDKATNVPARNPERADVRYPSACRGGGQRSAIDPVAPRCSSDRRQPDSQKRTAATPPRARVGSANLRKPAPFQMQTSMHWRFFGSRGRPKSPCVKPAPFQMQIQCTRDHHHATAAASGRRPPLGPASGQHRQCITQKNPARPSAPTRHTRQRIKPPICRLGIQSEQTSDTHQLAAAPASGRR